MLSSPPVEPWLAARAERVSQQESNGCATCVAGATATATIAVQ
jgi:hypothetical protein